MLAYWMTWLRSKLRQEEGQGLVEYALIIVLIAIALIAVLGFMGDAIGDTFSRISAALA